MSVESIDSFLHLPNLVFHEAGQNLIDLAPYINDARNLQLVLLGGRTGALALALIVVVNQLSVLRVR